MSTENTTTEAPAPERPQGERRGRGGRGNRGRGGENRGPRKEGQISEKSEKVEREPRGENQNRPRGGRGGERRGPRDENQPRNENRGRGGGRGRGGKGQEFERIPYRIRNYKPGEPLPDEEREREHQEYLRESGKARRPIMIKHKFHELLPFLTQEQKDTIKELDAKIKELSTVQEPTRDVTDKQVVALDSKIETSSKKLQLLRTQREALVKELHDTRARLPNTKLADELKAKRDELKNEGDKLKMRIDEAQKRLDETNQRKKDERTALGASSIKDIESEISRLEAEIETATLNNSQLKAKLGKIDNLKLSMGKMDKLDELKKTSDKIYADLSVLKQTKKELSQQIQDLNQQLTTIYDQAKPEFEALHTISDKIAANDAEAKSLVEQRSASYDARRKAVEDFYVQYDSYKKQSQEIENVAYQKKQILRTAEFELEKKSRGRNDDDDGTTVVVVKNPHEKEYNAAASLITYLKDAQRRISEEQGGAEAENQTGGKMVSKQEQDLINSLKKTKKAKKGKKVSTALEHSLKTMEQFAILDLVAPKDVSEIPALLEVLKQKKQQYEFTPPPPVVAKAAEVPKAGTEEQPAQEAQPEEKAEPAPQ